MDYSKMTDMEFDNILSDILSEYRGNQLLDIPGIYEIVAEHFNNDVLDRWAANQPTLECPECGSDDVYETPNTPTRGYRCNTCGWRGNL